MYNIIIADDHKVFRNGLSDYLETCSCVKTITEAENGQQVLTLLDEKPNYYDLVLMDLSMPVMDGSVATKLVVEKFKNIKVVCLTMYDTKDIVLSLFMYGAKGYVVKHADPIEIINAIETVMENGIYYSNDISEFMFEALTKIRRDFRKNDILLSEFEGSVLKLFCTKKSEILVAQELKMELQEVNKNLSKLYKKTGANSIERLMKYAVINNYL